MLTHTSIEIKDFDYEEDYYRISMSQGITATPLAHVMDTCETCKHWKRPRGNEYFGECQKRGWRFVTHCNEWA